MTVNDLTDDFDRRLEALQRRAAPELEVQLAINTYERLRTCKAIASSLLSKPGNAEVLAVFAGMQAASNAKASGRGK